MSLGSVQAAVRSAHRRARLARGFEHALAGGAAASLALAAAVLSGETLLSQGGLAVGALCGALAFWTLEIERRESRAEFARSLDRRVAAEGALATAFECETDAGASPIARLHAQRVAARFSASALRARVPLPSPAFAALLLCGAALASLARERAPAAGPHAGPALAGAQRPAPARAGLPGAESDAQDNPEGAAALPGSPDRHPSSPAVPEPADSGAMQVHERGSSGGSGEEARGGGESPSTGATSGREGAGGGSGDPSEAREPSGSEGESLTRASAESTMSGPPPETDVPPTPHTAPRPPGAPQAAAPLGRWWPRRHDAVVALYVERTRAALAGAGAGPR